MFSPVTTFLQLVLLYLQTQGEGRVQPLPFPWSASLQIPPFLVPAWMLCRGSMRLDEITTRRLLFCPPIRPSANANRTIRLLVFLSCLCSRLRRAAVRTKLSRPRSRAVERTVLGERVHDEDEEEVHEAHEDRP